MQNERAVRSAQPRFPSRAHKGAQLLSHGRGRSATGRSHHDRHWARSRANTMHGRNRLNDPGDGLEDNGRRVLTYADLRARYRGVDSRARPRAKSSCI